MSKRNSVLDQMHGNMPGILWPVMNREPVAGLAALLAVMDRTQWMKRRDIAARQFEQLAILAKHLTRESRQFEGRMRDAGLKPDDLASEEGLRRLPVLRRRDLQVPPEELHCASLPQSHMPLGESRTSGSTGEPVVIRRTAVNQLVWRAANIRTQICQGADFSKPCTTIRPQFNEYAVRDSRGAPMNLLFKTGPVQLIPITADIKQQAAWLREFRPDNIVIYPTNLDHLCRYFKENGGVPEGLNWVYTISETLHPRVRDQAQEVLGVKVLDKYSSQEVGLIAAECPESGLYHIISENLIVEVIKDDGSPCRIGDTGRVIVTDLHNYATPIVRYDIRDVAEVGGACPCGRGLPTLKRVLGRERNLLIKPDGTRNWPLIGMHAFRDVAPVQQYQFIQHDLERIEVRMVTQRPLTKSEEAKLAEIMKGALAYDCKLEFVYFQGELPRGKSGKFEEFVSLVPGA